MAWKLSEFFLRLLAVLWFLFGPFDALAQTDQRNWLREVQSHQCNSEVSTASLDGTRKLAFVVAVGRYRASAGGEIRNLRSPVKDAAAIFRVLVNEYKVPKENICVLLDNKATLEAFRKKFQSHIARRIESPKDQVFVFFAGHGSMVPDLDNDEPERDFLDETILLYESRFGDNEDLIDDEFMRILNTAYLKTPYITVVLDSCHSGSGARSIAPNATSDTTEDRMVRLAPDKIPDGWAGVSGDADILERKGSLAEDMPGLIVFSASDDKQPAIELPENGLFTAAFVHAIESSADAENLSARQIITKVKAWFSVKEEAQSPLLEGDLDRKLMSPERISHSPGWEVIGVSGEAVHVQGLPMPGFGDEAQVTISQDGKSIQASLTEFTGIAGKLSLLDGEGWPDWVDVGAKVVVEQPAPLWSPMKVGFSLATELADSALPDEIEKFLPRHRSGFPVVEVVFNEADATYHVDLTPNFIATFRNREGEVLTTLNTATTKEEFIAEVAEYISWLSDIEPFLSAETYSGNRLLDEEEALEFYASAISSNQKYLQPGCSEFPLAHNAVIAADLSGEFHVDACQPVKIGIASGPELDTEVSVLALRINFDTGKIACRPEKTSQTRHIFPRVNAGPMTPTQADVFGVVPKEIAAGGWYLMVALGFERSNVVTCRMIEDYLQAGTRSNTRTIDNALFGTRWTRTQAKLRFAD